MGAIYCTCQDNTLDNNELKAEKKPSKFFNFKKIFLNKSETNISENINQNNNLSKIMFLQSIIRGHETRSKKINNNQKPETLIKLNNDNDNYNNFNSVKSTYNEDQSQGTFIEKNIFSKNKIENNKQYSLINLNPHLSKSLSLINEQSEEQFSELLVSIFI